MELTRFDLNLLRVFEAVYRERSVTRAAERLHLTQAAVSNALARLRAAFGDRLFLRGPGGMTPTALAEELHRPILGALDGVRAAFDLRLPFDPASAEAAMVLGVSDHAEFVLGPALLARVAAEAPGLALTLRHCDRRNALPLLDEGAIQLALGVLPEPPERMTRQMLLRDELAVMVRAGHPAAGPSVASLDLDAYLAWPHLLVSAAAERTGAVDRALEAIGRTRRVAVVISHLLSAGPLLARSDLVCTLPGRVARPLAAAFGLVVFPVPAGLSLAAASLSQVWHGRYDRQPAHGWLRRIVAEIAREQP
ncbi:LysR family transcriptional regulator [Arenibaculum pallidiluteum]|uniref:LysR family transcriptional regulator n=1 Tax=Arenibaculum pallidiluteum TaxID=2812559 RepID=UPI001A959D53|nr:LysR family transcriptional regulator [Arenibaculum pallidiluteum]